MVVASKVPSFYFLLTCLPSIFYIYICMYRDESDSSFLLVGFISVLFYCFYYWMCVDSQFVAHVHCTT